MCSWIHGLLGTTSFSRLSMHLWNYTNTFMWQNSWSYPLKKVTFAPSPASLRKPESKLSHRNKILTKINLLSPQNFFYPVINDYIHCTIISSGLYQRRIIPRSPVQLLTTNNVEVTGTLSSMRTHAVQLSCTAKMLNENECTSPPPRCALRNAYMYLQNNFF